MDPQQNPDAVPNAQSGQICKVQQSQRPMRFPPEIMSMIFTEFLCKPAIHFASLTMQRRVPAGEGIYIPGLVYHLTPWSNGDMKSGHISTQVLTEICQLSRDVVRTATLDPVRLELDDGHGALSLDGATDILCFVVPRHWARQWRSSYNHLEGTANFGLASGYIGERLEDIHRAGVLVTSEMWHAVLSYWFIPDERHSYGSYEDLEGQLDIGSLKDMMLPPNIKDFYFIWPEISVDD
ncbi:hypothetical protein CONLIGDRAFT_141966 [Coniochaeta ligniaria NRRL 30616]|uniref:Uncharacterized protein n=1 Tax=Coniochaeta ligniaria NRRL 30616 TaxID=1408157 RepID=A0A1J7I7C1_9PEZI|nr:hypothetical protein CONLIGDRAFT_141966 [Coniochaeta ligniaria NRRL 30616]